MCKQPLSSKDRRRLAIRAAQLAEQAADGDIEAAAESRHISRVLAADRQIIVGD